LECGGSTPPFSLPVPIKIESRSNKNRSPFQGGVEPPHSKARRARSLHEVHLPLARLYDF